MLVLLLYSCTSKGERGHMRERLERERYKIMGWGGLIRKNLISERSAFL
jgi:hypothetical protein